MHCGYSVETEDQLLVFDWISGSIPETDKTKICFVTHSHQDHYNPAIFEMDFDYYIVSDDVDCELKTNRIKVKMGETVTIAGLEIHVYGSTDLGVSFEVIEKDLILFFAGDLNNWHWRLESTDEEIESMQNWYLALIEPLRNKKFNLIFFDIDPRLQVDYDLGIKQLLEIVKSEVIFPMHFTSDYESMKRYYEQTQIQNLVQVIEPQTSFEFQW